FIEQLMKTEIIPSIVSNEISVDEAEQFANYVLDRYRNPFIEHQWINITMEYSSKIRMRCLPVIFNYYNKFNELPVLMTAGFAAHFQFMKTAKTENDKFFGNSNGQNYLINDSNANLYSNAWGYGEDASYVSKILNNQDLWGNDFSKILGLENA